ncbi:MAG: DNA translocase FtsK [Clostridiales bacterium]|nr:DNA translocase FtsK [Candidatus Crickella merdequi]
MEIGSLLVKGFGKPGLLIIAIAMIIISTLLVVNTPISKALSTMRNKREAKRLLREMEEAERKKQEIANNVPKLPEIDFGNKREPVAAVTSHHQSLIEEHAPAKTELPSHEHDQEEYKPKTSFFSAFTSNRDEKEKAARDKKNLLELSRDEGLIGKDAADIAVSTEGKGLISEVESAGTVERPVTYGLSGETTKNEGYGLNGYDTYFGNHSMGYHSTGLKDRIEDAFDSVTMTSSVAAAGLASETARITTPKTKDSSLEKVTPAPKKEPAAEATAAVTAAAASSRKTKPEKLEDINTDDVANDLNSGFSGSNEDSGYKLPGIDLLKQGRGSKQMMSEYQLEQRGALLEKTLKDFGVDARILNVTQGASVTRYEVQPATGVKVSKITGLTDDIALSLRAKSIRIEAPIPGKAAVGIEVENEKPSPVLIRELIDSEEFRNADSKISFVVGKDISGNNVISNLKDMPHLLIAGTTGSGKSVCVNSIITSILYKAKPNEVKLILIDPKVVEFENYNGIPHLLTSVVTDPRKASRALAEAVAEMNKRYDEFAKVGVKDLESYNELMIANQEPQNCRPKVVIIIDELADLMMAAPSQVEESICRLAQKARAAGMHLVIATQRPSVDVVTGLIKANIPSRIALSVSSQIDSRTIIDMAGAEKLLGKGDMLFSPVGSSKPYRIQGPYISDTEIARVINAIKSQGTAEYDEALANAIEGTAEKTQSEMSDELTEDAIAFIFKSKQASVSMLQRRFRIGYNRAARIIDEIEEMGIIGPSDGSRGRQILMTEEEYYGITEDAEEEATTDTDDGGVPEEISRYNEIIG